MTDWLRIHDLFKRSGITSYSTAEMTRTTLSMKHVACTAATRAQPHNLKAGLTLADQVDDWDKFWNHARANAGIARIDRISTTYER